MDRRNFLLNACQACAALALVPAIASLEGCATAKGTVADGMLTVPLGSLKGDTTLVKTKGLADNLLLVKRADGSYTALVLNCPHKHGPVKEEGAQLVCEWHGSRFDLEGKVLNGPAKADLKHYPVEVTGEVVKVMME
jgi:nitrite reductase/ring-hydroxylating ferredoxin subunit